MSDKVLAYTMFRLFMGINMFMHGAVRLGPNYSAFVDWTQNLFIETWLPNWLVVLEARLIPGAEMVVGILLFIGYQTRYAVLGAGVLMTTLMFGMVILQDWELVNRHIIYMLAFYVLLDNTEFNKYSLDGKGS